MPSPVSRFMHWLHTGWPAGTVEKLPGCDERGLTNLPGVYIAGDLTGIPLLKFSAETAARAVREIAAELRQRSAGTNGVLDLAIIGGGVAGISAAIEAKKAGLAFAVYEATQVFSTVANFPKGKPIYAYPTEMKPAGGLQFSAGVKEALLEEMESQRHAAEIEVVPARIERLERQGDALLLHHADETTTSARRVIVAIGRSGNFRKLGVPGEDLPKVYNRLHDPQEFAGKDVLVAGGGDSALETAIALGACGARVTLSYRKMEFTRPKPENLDKLRALERDPDAAIEIEQPTSERVTAAMTEPMRRSTPRGSVTVLLGSTVQRITSATAALRAAGGHEVRIMNDVVFSMLGREAPLDFFRRSGIAIRGEWTPKAWISFSAFFLFCVALYLWKATGTDFSKWLQGIGFFPFALDRSLPAWGSAWTNPKTLLGTLAISMKEPGFYYSIAYSLCIVVFGIRRIRRRKMPYVTAQTLTLMAVQCIPLFLLPYLVLPWLGHNGAFDLGIGKTIGDALFPVENHDYGHGREYWRAFGFILAWPLFIWNVFSGEPLWAWLTISFLQTFVIIPWMVLRWGKGAYCGWICSCGALAETVGDEHRHKMPHGPFWNRLNMTGQAILWIALLLLVFRMLSWAGVPLVGGLYSGLLSGWSLLGVQLNYYHAVDILLAGIVGVACYFWFSGRVWCRFACPLAALMHIYARFSRYRIFPEKKKCISCNVCTSVCHQGIDVMSFANKGLPMEDPQCVRCSACVQECPTGVLAFGRLGREGVPILDRLAASPVRLREGKR